MRGTFWGIGLSVVLGWSGIAHANLVTNGDFESGDLTGWATSLNANIGVTSGGVIDGNFSAALGDDTATPGTLSQLLATTAGTTYTISFLLQNLDTTNTNSLVVMFGSDTLLSESGANQDTSPVAESFQDTAGADGLLLAFTDTNPNGGILLDDVSVTPLVAVPEPSALALFGTGLTALFAAGLRRRRRLPT